jgi:superkiller protein 3
MKLMIWRNHSLWNGEFSLLLCRSKLTNSLSSENPSIQVVSTLAAVAITSSDSDLIEATISELQTQSTHAKATQDPAGHSDLILFLNALPTSEDQAIEVLESSVISKPYDMVARNRLAKALIGAGRYEDATQALAVLGGDGEVLSERLRLRGIAEIVAGLDDKDGMGLVQKSVVVRPWEEAGWEALAWARKVQVEGGDEGEAE